MLKILKLCYFSTYLGVFLTWNTLPIWFQAKMWSENPVTEPTTRISKTKANPKFAKKLPLFFILFIISLAYWIQYQWIFLFSRQNTYTDVIHPVLLLSIYFYLCLILCLHFFFISHCWASLIQSRYTIRT